MSIYTIDFPDAVMLGRAYDGDSFCSRSSGSWDCWWLV